MAKKKAKASTRAGRAGKRLRKSEGPSSTRGAASGSSAVQAPAGAAEDRFVGGLLIRGEAAKRDRKGRVPLDATHRIKKQKRGGQVEVERVRFKLF